MSSTPLPQQLATLAESFVNNLGATTYQYDEFIDEDAGIFNCDCNSFVGYTLQSVAARHYDLVPIESGRPRPRAFEYAAFFAGLDATPASGWTSVASIQAVQRGDIVAWQITPTLEAGEDTGHVVFAAESPNLLASGVITLRVYDSAAYPHFEDTRGPGQPFQSGVGTGFLNFTVDPDTNAVTITFGPGDTPFATYLVGIGRPGHFTA